MLNHYLLLLITYPFVSTCCNLVTIPFCFCFNDFLQWSDWFLSQKKNCGFSWILGLKKLYSILLQGVLVFTQILLLWPKKGFSVEWLWTLIHLNWSLFFSIERNSFQLLKCFCWVDLDLDSSQFKFFFHWGMCKKFLCLKLSNVHSFKTQWQFFQIVKRYGAKF